MTVSSFQNDAKYTIEVRSNQISAASVGHTLCLLALHSPADTLTNMRDVTLVPLLRHSDPSVRYGAVISLGFLCAGIFTKEISAKGEGGGEREHERERRDVLLGTLGTLEAIAFGLRNSFAFFFRERICISYFVCHIFVCHFM